jgi:hypothetical protein
MTTLTLKMLLLDTIGKIKHGNEMSLNRNIKHVRRDFKKSVGLKSNCTNEVLLEVIKQVYIDNDLTAQLNETLKRFKLETI